MPNPTEFVTSNNSDNLYYHQAMKAPNTREFHKAIIKEVNAHRKQKNWERIPIEHVPKQEQVLPSVWELEFKRDIKTKLLFKHKACLNVHGGKQEYDSKLFETFSPVVTWFTIRMVLVLSLINEWSTSQVEFVLAFPHANIEFDMYMEIPQNIETKGGSNTTHVLKLLKNLYGQR